MVDIYSDLIGCKAFMQQVAEHDNKPCRPLSLILS